jgi:NADH-quinone oxidoreductase subunit G
MCYRCVRVCGEDMDVWALGIANRNSSQLIVPNKGDYLECEECGMCIDIEGLWGQQRRHVNPRGLSF